LLKDAITLLGYVFVTVVVNQLGAQRRRLAELAERQRDELANEIELAAEVQQGILPRSIPQVPGFDFAARMYPAKIVAGDYYGFIEFPAGEIAVVVADVSGKGVAAGLLMPSIEVALRMDAARFSSTCDLLQTFNNVVCQITGGHRFIFAVLWKALPSIAFFGIHKRRTQPAAGDSCRHRSKSSRQRRPSAGCAPEFALRE
jgi:Stage II sporulation protein E (SpoIIE)